jgi:hypothetical protein
MSTYPNQRYANGQSYAVLYIDQNLTRKAALTDATGKPIAASQISANGNEWPLFNYAGSGPLYFRAVDGTVDHLLPTATYSPTAISGSRGAATAAVLTSLLAALASQGVIVDNTTA